MSAFAGIRKITEWIKSYELLLFILFIGFGWLISWLSFIIFALIFVE